jgi:Zn finger protein HypA/HybF involved in hydrogenase expression
MVVKVKPFVIKCQACGWSKVVSPKSDVLMANEFFETCHLCESKDLTKKDIGIIKSFILGIKK